MAESTAVAQVSKAQLVKSYITENIGAVKEALPRVGLTPEALTRTALSQIYKNPLLLECDKTSLMRSIVEAASLGLSFSLGRAYLVPFRNKVKNKQTGVETWRMEAQLMPGYLGLADIARRSGEVSSITTQAVYQGDDFKYEFGLERDVLQHKPTTEPDDAKLTHAYAIVRFKDGGYQLVVMTKKQIDAIRKRSKSSEFGPWKTDYAAMAKKTVIKQVLKLCPASIELIRAIGLDNAVETGEAQALGAEIFGEDDVIEVQAESDEPKPSKTATVKDALKGAKQTATSAVDDVPDDRSTLLSDIGKLWPRIWKKTAEADIEVSAATGGKLQSLAQLEADGTVEQVEQVLNHFRIVADEKGVER